MDFPLHSLVTLSSVCIELNGHQEIAFRFCFGQCSFYSLEWFISCEKAYVKKKLVKQRFRFNKCLFLFNFFFYSYYSKNMYVANFIHY